jgi:hypothetical protein
MWDKSAAVVRFFPVAGVNCHKTPPGRQRLLASVEQAEKELAEAGFDVAAERARAEAFLVSLEGAPSIEERAAAAADLRRRAAEACDKAHFEECVSLLDQAAVKDPAGDTTPEVRRLREKATATEPRPK